MIYSFTLYASSGELTCATAGFYPVTVTYLSLFYTRFEFGRRLSLFYGQAAVGGALGGIISYLVFSRFHDDPTAPQKQATWRAWQVLFLLEGILTMAVAVVGYFWLPHSAETAWFLTPKEREYAASRVIRDRDQQNQAGGSKMDENHEDIGQDEESRGLLQSSTHSIIAAQGQQQHSMVDDRGLSPHDIVTSILGTKIWHLLACNILSSIPVYAFSVFMPLVLAPLIGESNPSLVNLMTAPPHFCGVVVLFLFARYSDKHQVRLQPILCGLVIVVAGLVLVVMLPTSWPIPRYIALNVLLSGTYVASPLTVAWISGNTPSPGKRAVLLGINGWGNLAGILAAILFRPKYAADGYIIPFWWTLVSVAFAGMGYWIFLHRLQHENQSRKRITRGWTEEHIQRENEAGRGPVPQSHLWLSGISNRLKTYRRSIWLATWIEDAMQAGRQGDEKMTFVYGL